MKVGMRFEREYTDELGPCHIYTLARPVHEAKPLAQAERRQPSSNVRRQPRYAFSKGASDAS